MASLTISGMENCKIVINGIEFTENGYISSYNSGISNGNNFSIQAIVNEGFVFDNTLSANIEFRDDYNDPFNPITNITTFNPSYSDNWNSNFTIFDIEVTTSDEVHGIRVKNFIAVEDSSSGGTNIPDYGSSIVNKFANIYNVEPEELKTLSEEVFLDTDATRADLESFITGLYILPFNIDDIKEDTKSNIILADFEADTTSYTLKDSILTVEIAEIEVTETYGNSYDYINTKCILFLPYFEKQELEIARIINKTVKVIFIIDLFDGIANCNIFADEDLILNIKQEIGRNIPYYSEISRNFAEAKVGKVRFNTITLPYIEVVRNIPYNEVGELGQVSSEWLEFDSLTGYFQATNILLKTKATKREQEEIRRLSLIHI